MVAQFSIARRKGTGRLENNSQGSDEWLLWGFLYTLVLSLTLSLLCYLIVLSQLPSVMIKEKLKTIKKTV